MHEPSDGIAEEVERQLQLALAAAGIAARRAIATRQHQVEQAQLESAQNAQAVAAQIDGERLLAAAYVQPVFDPEWWETAGPQNVADMWQQANSWRDPDRVAATPTIFDRAAFRIGQEVRDRAGLDPTQVVALAAVQELEHEHHATLAPPAEQEAGVAMAEPDLATPRGFDDPQRREQLRTRLVAAGVPEPRSRRGHSPISAKPETLPRLRRRPSPPRPPGGPWPLRAPVASSTVGVEDVMAPAPICDRLPARLVAGHPANAAVSLYGLYDRRFR